MQEPEQPDAKTQHNKRSQNRQSNCFPRIRRRRRRIIGLCRSRPDLLFGHGHGRYHDPFGLPLSIIDDRFIGRIYRLSADDRLFAKIILRRVEIFAWQSGKSRLGLVDQRRAVFCAKPDDFFVVTFVADRAIFHKCISSLALIRQNSQNDTFYHDF